MKKTKIICSIGPASASVDVMEKMVMAGMDVARINFSHATRESKLNIINIVREVRKRTNKNVGILYDTKGPEFRNQMMENDGVDLVSGKNIRIVKERNGGFGFFLRFVSDKPDLAIYTTKKSRTII